MKNVFIWILSIAIAVTAALSAMGAIAKDKAPALVINLSPMNGFAAENLAAAIIKASIADNKGRFPDHVAQSTTQIARTAFVSEPITPAAVAVLALGKNDNVTRELIGNALFLSRRQPLVTGWMIADSGVREDLTGLLNYYDTTLRTSSSAASLFMPTIAGALANDSFVTPFVNLLAKKPPWESQFWGTVVGMPDSLRNAARLRAALYNPSKSDKAYRDPDLIIALVNDLQFEQAKNLYRLLVGQKKAGSLLENGSFEIESQYPPIDWQLFSTGSYGASIANGNLQLSAIRNSGGLFARQLVELPANTVKIEVKIASEIPNQTELSLVLQCAEKIDNKPQLVRIKLEEPLTTTRISNRGSGCRYYWLDVTGRASENGSGFDVNITTISLKTEMRDE